MIRGRLVMRAKNARISEETKEAVCRDYLRGDKIIVITMEHHIDSSTLYRILDEKHIQLRRGDLKVPRKKNDSPRALSSVDPVAERKKAEEIVDQIKKGWRPGDFFITISPEDLRALDDADFILVWDALGLVVKARARLLKEKKAQHD
jgi:transposase-like protein